MSELGNEATSTVIHLGEKGFELLLKLLEYLMGNQGDRLDNKIKKEQLKQLKNENKRESAKDYLKEHRGRVAVRKLQRSGEKLSSFSASMTPEQMKQFNLYARRSGIPYAVVSNQKVVKEIQKITEQIKKYENKGELSAEDKKKYDMLNAKLKELNKRKDSRIIICQEKDLEFVKDITNWMNRDIEFENMEQEMKAYEDAGIENLSPEDRKKYEDLRSKIENMAEKECHSFNNKNNEEILNGNPEKPVWEEMEFSKALSRVTDRRLGNESFFVCDRSNPDNYIEVNLRTDKSKEGISYTNTEYKVFRQGVEQRSDVDSQGNFRCNNNGKHSQEHWQKLVKEIKEKGNFSDDVLIFPDKKAYLQYKENFNRVKNDMENEEDVLEQEAGAPKDYAGKIDQLIGQLQEKKVMINEQGEACHVDTKEPIKLANNMSKATKVDCKETLNICVQINMYEKLLDSQNQLAFVQREQKLNEQNFEDQGRCDSAKEAYEQIRDDLHTQEQVVSQNISSLEAQVKNLQVEREKLSSVKIVLHIQNEHREKLSEKEVQQDRADEKDGQFTHREEHTQSKENWNNQTRGVQGQGQQAVAEKANAEVMQKE